MLKSILFSLLLVGWFHAFRINYPGSNEIKINIAVGPFASKEACEEDQVYALAFFNKFFEGPFLIVPCQKK